jgi:Tat protein secretion system quality control protein TatD with DNase activity
LHIRDESEEAYESAYKIVKESGVKKGILHAFTGN